MGRPPVVKTEKLLEAARRLFLEHGFAATTAAIARAAGISEGSIFKRFATKEELFFAALGIPEPAWIDGLKGRAGQGRVEDALAEILLQIIEFFRELVPRVTMLWSCRALGSGGPIALFRDRADAPPLRALRGLTDYFEQEARLGRIAIGSAEIAARLFLGSAQTYIFFEMLAPATAPPAAEYARGVVELLLRGLSPDTNATPSTEHS
jgi:AcrR family transcriptional regulator